MDTLAVAYLGKCVGRYEPKICNKSNTTSHLLWGVWKADSHKQKMVWTFLKNSPIIENELWMLSLIDIGTTSLRD